MMNYKNNFNSAASFATQLPEDSTTLFDFLTARRDILICDSEDLLPAERLILIPGDYCVYVHTCPSGKRYVGVTVDDREIDGEFPGRWGKDGSGYTGNYKMVEAMKEYPWEEWKHEFLVRGVSRSVSLDYEEFFIKFFDSYHHGLNLNEGGSGRPIGKRGNPPRICPVLVEWADGQRATYRTQVEAARATGMSQSTVSNCVNGKSPQTKMGITYTRLLYDFPS